MTKPMMRSRGLTNSFHSVASATKKAMNGRTTTRMFVMRTARLIRPSVLPEQRPRQLRAHRRDLGHRGADVRGAAGGDLVVEVGHVGAVGREADLHGQQTLLV